MSVSYLNGTATLSNAMVMTRSNGRVSWFAGAASVDRAFSQLAVITTVRDSILHWGRSLEPTNGYFTVSDDIRAHAGRARKEYQISPNALEAMTDDLANIMLVLHYYSRMSKPDLPEPQAPWRYTPAPPKP